MIPSSRIDYILVGLPRKGRGKVESVGLAGAMTDGVWPSDHFAVVADLRR
jgi:endonuclease/exonuclease/phosphatase family metal-dependent hydrolase